MLDVSACLPLILSYHLRLVLTCYLLIHAFIVSSISDISHRSGLFFFVVALFGATLTLRNRAVLPLVVYYCYAMRFPLPHVGPSELTRKHRAFLNALGAMQLTSCENHLRISPDLFMREAASCE